MPPPKVYAFRRMREGARRRKRRPIGQTRRMTKQPGAPHCSIDSIIAAASGYPITKEFMQQMQAHWFGRGTIIGEVTCEL